MNMHVATPTERLLYAAHQERLRKFWPVKPQAETVKETTAPALPNAWLRLAWEYLEPGIQPKDCRLSIGQIQYEVCEYFGITASDLRSDRKQLNIVRPRQIGIFLCKKLTTFSYPMIARHFGNRHHTAALQAARRIESLMTTDEALASDIAAIERRLA